MIRIDFKKFIEGSAPPYKYQVINTGGCNCASVENATGTLTGDGFAEFSIILNDEDCITTCANDFDLVVTDAQNCQTTIDLTLVNPCDDFTVGPITKISDYSFTVPVSGGVPNYTYQWVYNKNVFYASVDDAQDLHLAIIEPGDNPGIKYPAQNTVQVIVTDAAGCREIVSLNVPICKALAENNDTYLAVFCEDVRQIISAVPCAGQLTDWSTFEVTRIIRETDGAEVTSNDIKIYFDIDGSGSGNDAVLNILADGSEYVPGVYTVYWKVKDDLGIYSTEAYFRLDVIPCDQGLQPDPPTTSECTCNVSSCEVDENGELRTKLSECIVSECGCEAPVGRFLPGSGGNSGGCIDPSTINIVSGPYIPGAVVYYDSFREEMVYIPAPGSVGVDLVEFTAETYDGKSTGIVTWTIYLNCYEAPELVDDTACVVCCETVNIPVLDNDDPGFVGGFDLDSIIILQYPSYGTVEIQPDGSINYTALCNTGGATEDTFQYTVKNLASNQYADPPATVTVEISCAGEPLEGTICIEDAEPIAEVATSLDSLARYSVTFKGYQSTGLPLEATDEYEIELIDTTNALTIASATFFIDDDLTNIKPGTDNNWTTKVTPYLDNVTLDAAQMAGLGVNTLFNKEAFAIAESYANEYDDDGVIIGSDVAIDLKFVVRVTDVSEAVTSVDDEDAMPRVRMSTIEDTNYEDQMANPDGNLACTWAWVGGAGTYSTFTTSASDLHPSQTAYTWFSQTLNPLCKPPGKLVEYKISNTPAETVDVNYANEMGLINAIYSESNRYFAPKNWAFRLPTFNLFGNNSLIFVHYSEEDSEYLEHFDIVYLNGTVNNGKRTQCTLSHYILF